MRINGEGPPDEEPSSSEALVVSEAVSTTAPTSTGGDDMIMNENDTIRERVADLEKKVHDQADEIVCLRSTLADVLRRLNNLEGRGAVAIGNHVQPSKEGLQNTLIQVQRRPGIPSATTTNSHRRPNQYQSSNSLQSDGLSSNSASPIPSPSPSSMRSSPSPRHTPSPSRAPTYMQLLPTQACNNLKKWSSSQDFSAMPPQLAAQRKSTLSGSMVNLHVKPPTVISSRHGTKEATFNAEDGYLKMYLRGRPVVMYAPSELMQEYSLTKVNSLPLQRLRLDWVYGYRGKDCRNNLNLLPTGEIVYFIAAVVILYNVEDQMQRHYLGHTDDVKCLAVHPNKLLIATGQVAGHERRDTRKPGLMKPHVRVWDSVSLNTLHIIGIGDFERAVSCLAFSKADGGAYLCAVDEAPDHNMSLWDWQKGERGHKITETKCASETVLGIEFHPMDRSTIITYGRGHVSFWNYEGMTLTKKLGMFEKKQDKPKFILSLAFSDVGDILTGDSNGNIFIWTRGSNRIAKGLYNIHPGGVFSICTMKDGNIVTGGRDGRLMEWDNQYKKTGRMAQLPELVGPVRVITQGKGSSVLIGTTRNCILQGNFNLSFEIIVQGHTDELWGLAIHPTQNQFITCGHDRQIHLWDTMSHSVVWSKYVGEPAQSATFSPDGSILIVCTNTGQWFVINAHTREVISSYSDGSEPIFTCKYSPDGKFLALASHDNMIYIYQVNDDFTKYSRIGRCAGHSSFITHFDWSEDSTFIQSNSGDYEILFWNATVCRQATSASQLRDVKWSTHNCTLSFYSFGIWPEGCDGSDVNTCDRTHDGKLLATGDDFGRVRLFSFPACQPKSLCHIYGGHSSHVTAVGFLPDDNRLISLGGRDSSIMQWAIY